MDLFRVKLVDLRAPVLEPMELGEGYMPSISPDGQMIAVGGIDASKQSTIDIWLDRGVGRRFTLAMNAFGPSWSPDSRWLVYERFVVAENLIHVFLVDTRSWQEREVGTSIPCQCDGVSAPRWASNGRFFSYRAPVSGSGIVSLDGLPVEDLPPVADWNPDGTRYLWQRTTKTDQGYMFEVGIYDLANGQATVLVPAVLASPDTTAATGNAFWSSDGRLAFAGLVVKGSPLLRVYDADGRQVKDLSSGYVNSPSPGGRFLLSYHSGDCGPGLSISLVGGLLPASWAAATCMPIDAQGEFAQGSWAPTGNTFAFATRRPVAAFSAAGPVETLDIFVLNAETLDVRPLATDLRGISCVTWSPNGRYVIFHGCGL